VFKPLWNVVRKNVKLEPEQEQTEDVRAVLVGLSAIVEGLGLSGRTRDLHTDTKNMCTR
jgi:hypothetical protein